MCKANQYNACQNKASRTSVFPPLYKRAESTSAGPEEDDWCFAKSACSTNRSLLYLLVPNILHSYFCYNRLFSTVIHLTNTPQRLGIPGPRLAVYSAVSYYTCRARCAGRSNNPCAMLPNGARARQTHCGASRLAAHTHHEASQAHLSRLFVPRTSSFRVRVGHSHCWPSSRGGQVCGEDWWGALWCFIVACCSRARRSVARAGRC